MAAASSGVGSPPPNEDQHPVQEWELLSASALLAQGHGLGFGLPPLTNTTPGFRTGRVEADEVSRRGAASDAETSLIFRGKDGVSLPLNVSQIAVVSSTATSSVEPFTEGWKPQFRIAGAPLQENYYSRDPFGPASDTSGSLEPFLNMERSFSLQSSRAADDEMDRPLCADKKLGILHVDYSERGGVKRAASPHQQENSDKDSSGQKEGLETCLINPDALDPSKPSSRHKYAQESKQMWKKGRSVFSRKSYVTWSIALTTVLLGFFFVTYCSPSDNSKLVHELSTSDEVGKPSQ